MRIYKKLSLLLLLSIFILLSGCGNSNSSKGLIGSNYFDDLENIIVYKGVSYKDISDKDAMDKLIYTLKNIEGKKLDVSSLKAEDFTGTSYRIDFIYKKDTKSISFINNKILYNDIWYKTNTNIENIYENIDLKENIDKNKKKAQLRKDKRKDLPTDNSLIGKWKYDNGTVIAEFTDNEIVHFTKNNDQWKESRRFKYEINSSTDDQVHLTAYSKKGLIFKGQKLFQMYILIDDTNTNIILKKEMEGSIMNYENKLIYVDDEGFELGNFDSFFFIENREE